MKEITVSLLVSAMVMQALAHTTSSDWQDFNDHSYYFDSNTKTWYQAELACRDLKGHLASIHSFPEHRFIQTLIRKVAGEGVTTWIGGFDCQEDEVWFWSDGSPLDYTYWDSGHPDDGQCLTMSKDHDLLWTDETCSNTFAYVCKKDHH